MLSSHIATYTAFRRYLVCLRAIATSAASALLRPTITLHAPHRADPPTSPHPAQRRIGDMLQHGGLTLPSSSISGVFNLLPGSPLDRA